MLGSGCRVEAQQAKAEQFENLRTFYPDSNNLKPVKLQPENPKTKP
jgi:hypothetical protein